MPGARRRPWTRPHTRLALAGLVLSLAWSGFLIRPHLDGVASPLDRIEAPIADLRFLLAGPRRAPEEVVVIAIDDATVAAAGAYPLPRRALAGLIRGLAAAGPRAIALDVLFLEAGEPEADRDLAEALAAGPSILALAASFDRAGSEARAAAGPFEGLAVADTLSRPATSVARGLPLGLVNVATDHGGTPRHLPLLTVAEGALQPALSLAAARLGRDLAWTRDAVRIGAVATPLDLGAALALRFYGPQGSLRTVSAAALDESARASLRDRILVVGATAFGNGDTFPTPFDPLLPGVEVLATGVAHLVRGDALARTLPVRRADAAIATGLPILVILLLSLARVGLGLLLVGIVLASVLGFNAVLFAHGIWLALALPGAALLPVALTLCGRLWLDRSLQRRLEGDREALLRFHPPRVAERLSGDPGYLAAPVEQRAAVLFVDLSGFTGLSERLGPVQTRALLAEMHDRVEAVANTHDGAVTSFMGDGAMVLFGLPEPRSGDARRAAEATLALAAALESWLAGHGLAIGVRIGAHSGPVVVSRLGGARNQHITATGDTVNVASRLLEVAKAEGARIVLSGDLIAEAALAPEVLGFGPQKRITIRGRTEPLDLRALA